MRRKRPSTVLLSERAARAGRAPSGGARVARVARAALAALAALAGCEAPRVGGRAQEVEVLLAPRSAARAAAGEGAAEGAAEGAEGAAEGAAEAPARLIRLARAPAPEAQLRPQALCLPGAGGAAPARCAPPAPPARTPPPLTPLAWREARAGERVTLAPPAPTEALAWLDVREGEAELAAARAPEALEAASALLAAHLSPSPLPPPSPPAPPAPPPADEARRARLQAALREGLREALAPPAALDPSALGAAPLLGVDARLARPHPARPLTLTPLAALPALLSDGHVGGWAARRAALEGALGGEDDRARALARCALTLSLLPELDPCAPVPPEALDALARGWARVARAAGVGEWALARLVGALARAARREGGAQGAAGEALAALSGALGRAVAGAALEGRASLGGWAGAVGAAGARLRG
ncbi:MAG: hypothetical protein FJ138_15825, partial [Deltaproteobacteria bacterium]|nr:hypothetical protein [Deltaproteobacteria bacterium]